jgi:hypothetical protein
LEYQKLLGSPHFLSLVVAKYLTLKIDESRIGQREILGAAEIQTGYHEYNHLNHMQIDGARVHFDSDHLGSYSAKLSGSALNLARLEMTLEILRMLLKIILLPVPLPAQVNPQLGQGATAKTTPANVAFLLSYGEYQLTDVKYLQNRIQIQLTAVSGCTG